MDIREAYRIIGNELQNSVSMAVNIADLSLIKEAWQKIDNYACLGQIAKIKKLLADKDLQLFQEENTQDFATTRVIDAIAPADQQGDQTMSELITKYANADENNNGMKIIDELFKVKAFRESVKKNFQ